MKMAKKRGKEIKFLIPESVTAPIDGPSLYDGPTYDLTWSIPIVEEKFTIDYSKVKFLFFWVFELLK